MENKNSQNQHIYMNRPWITLQKIQNSAISKRDLKDLRTGLLLWVVFLLFLALVQFST